MKNQIVSNGRNAQVHIPNPASNPQSNKRVIDYSPINHSNTYNLNSNMNGSVNTVKGSNSNSQINFLKAQPQNVEVYTTTQMPPKNISQNSKKVSQVGSPT